MYKLISVLILMALCLSGCAQTNSQPNLMQLTNGESRLTEPKENGSELSGSTSSPAMPDIHIIMNDYQSVLDNQSKFFWIDNQEYMYLSQYLDLTSDGLSIPKEFISFAIIDLDNDSIPEVVLWERVNGNDDVSYLILHYDEEVVYGYLTYYRGFNQLKDDGTFSFSSSASNSGFGTLILTDKDYNLDKITYCRSFSDYSGGKTTEYFVNYMRASQEGFDLAIDMQSKKPDVTWSAYTTDNIAAIFSEY